MILEPCLGFCLQELLCVAMKQAYIIKAVLCRMIQCNGQQRHIAIFNQDLWCLSKTLKSIEVNSRIVSNLQQPYFQFLHLWWCFSNLILDLLLLSLLFLYISTMHRIQFNHKPGNFCGIRILLRSRV